jgi:hypothetical protein
LVAEAGAGVACGLDAGRLAEVLDGMKRDPVRFAQTNRDRFNRRCQARWLADRLESLI